MIDFLSLVLPAEGTGWYVAFNGSNKAHSFFRTLPELEAQLRAIDASGGVAYYATAAFTETRRLITTVAAKKAFYLDIDFKDIADPDPASLTLTTLKSFCKHYAIPPPTYLVATGGGIHIYWALNDAIDRDTWKRYAEGLKKACIEFGLKADHPITADAARIMRPIDTLNRKYHPPYKIEGHLCGKPVGLDQLAPFSDAPPVVVPQTAQALDIEISTIYRKYWIKSIIQSNACPMMARALTVDGQRRDNMPEGLWADLMATCSQAEDGVLYAHEFSRLDPERYIPADVDRKLLSWKGQQHPRSCARFASHGQCGTCQHRISTDSPIKFGYFSPISDAPPEIVADPADPSEVIYALLRERLASIYPEDEEGFLASYRPPNRWPVSYGFDPVSFETFSVKVEENGEGERVRVKTRLWAGVFWPQHKLLQDNGEYCYEFVFWPRRDEDPAREYVARDEFGSDSKVISLLTAHGFPLANQDRRKSLLYFFKMIDLLNQSAHVLPMADAFGWSQNHTLFNLGQAVMGVREGVPFFTPTLLSPSIKLHNFKLAVKGSLDAWKHAVATYNVADAEPYQLILMGGFASILMPFTSNKVSHLIHFYSDASGSGKTSVQQAALSIWAEPVIDRARSTYNALIDTFSIYGNVPGIVDEITKLSGEELRRLAFDIAAGTPRVRLSITGERIQHGKPWVLIGLSSGNNDIEYEVRHTGNAEGELARITSIAAPSGVLKHENEEDYKLIFSNYGLAGRVFVRAVLEIGADRLKELIKHERDAMSEEFCVSDVMRQAMRFRLDAFAAILVANDLATSLGLTSFERIPMRNLMSDLMTNKLGALGNPVANIVNDIQGYIGQYPVPRYLRRDDGSLSLAARVDGMMNRNVSDTGNLITTTARPDVFIVVNDRLPDHGVASIGTMPALYVMKALLPRISPKLFPSVRTDPAVTVPQQLRGTEFTFTEVQETVLGTTSAYYRIGLPRTMIKAPSQGVQPGAGEAQTPRW